MRQALKLRVSNGSAESSAHFKRAEHVAEPKHENRETIYIDDMEYANEVSSITSCMIHAAMSAQAKQAGEDYTTLYSRSVWLVTIRPGSSRLRTERLGGEQRSSHGLLLPVMQSTRL